MPVANDPCADDAGLDGGAAFEKGVELLGAWCDGPEERPNDPPTAGLVGEFAPVSRGPTLVTTTTAAINMTAAATSLWVRLEDTGSESRRGERAMTCRMLQLRTA